MNILAIGPHPDDIEYGCGGTLLEFAKSKKNKIYFLVVTKGEVGGSSLVRTAEQGASAKILGAVVFLGWIQGHGCCGRQALDR